MMKIILLALLSFAIHDASAAMFGIGLSNSIIENREQNLRYKDDLEPLKNLDFAKSPTFSVIEKLPYDIIISASTNRIINRPVNREMLDRKNKKFNMLLTNRTNLVSIGYLFNKSYVISGFITQSKIKKDILYKSKSVSIKKYDTHYFGIGISRFLSAKSNIGLAIIAPNMTAKTGLGVNMNFNYFF